MSVLAGYSPEPNSQSATCDERIIRQFSDPHSFTADPATVFHTYCDKDYSADCPPDWDASDSGYCTAGLSYSGFLDPYFPIPQTVTDKQRIERKYQISWPCQLSCIQDFTLPCPKGWAVKDTGECISHNSSLTFDGFSASESERKVFSANNNVPWPCSEQCKRDYHSFPCPVGWEEVLVEGVTQCQAPPWYQGGCPGIQSLKGLTTDLLKEFEARCKVQFPCQTCELRDYDSAPCPEFFTLNGEAMLCERENPKSKATDSCPDSFDPKHDLEAKQALEAWCGVRWPCIKDTMPDCVQDFSYPCPHGWLVEGTTKGGWSAGGDGTICTAGQDYRGRCPRTFQVVQTSAFKMAMAHHCLAFWPCLHNSAAELWYSPIPVPTNPSLTAVEPNISGPIDHRGKIFGQLPQLPIII